MDDADAFPDPPQRLTWAQVGRTPRFPGRVVATAVGIVAALFLQAQFLTWNENRAGVVLPDPLLDLFAPQDVSMITFGVIYAALVAALAVLVRHPTRLLPALQGYALLALLRIGLMYCAPLDPPPRIIPLRDPVVEIVGTGVTLTRDLFFSGHTGTLFLLYLALPRGRVRVALLVGTVLVAALTVWQHTHYVVDVLVAPFFAYGCLHLALRLFNRGLRLEAVEAAAGKRP